MADDPKPLRTCRECERALPLTEYTREPGRRDGLKTKCRDCCKALTYAWRRAGGGAEQRKDYNLRKNYGITLDEYRAMQARQGNRCRICGLEETSVDPRMGKLRDLAVDHCHTTGKVRGLLCARCNQGLGYFRDDPSLLLEAMRYLR